MQDFQLGERINSIAIETGELTSGATGECVLSICMYTTRGRRLLGQALKNEVLSNGLVKKDGVEYAKVRTTFLDAAFSFGTFKGFFGRIDPSPVSGGLMRVGVIWGDNPGSSNKSLSTTVADVGPLYDTDESSTTATIETLRGQAGVAEEQVWALREACAEHEVHIAALELEKAQLAMASEVAKTERNAALSRLQMVPQPPSGIEFLSSQLEDSL